jgi:hypothetical protein
MGSPLTVLAWDGRFDYIELYAGRSWLKALWALWTWRRAYGCVKLEVRV